MTDPFHQLPDRPPDPPTGRDALDEAMLPVWLTCGVVALLAIGGIVWLVVHLAR